MQRVLLNLLRSAGRGPIEPLSSYPGLCDVRSDIVLIKLAASLERDFAADAINDRLPLLMRALGRLYDKPQGYKNGDSFCVRKWRVFLRHGRRAP